MTPTSPSLMPKSAQNKTTPSKPTAMATQKTPTKKPATLKTAVTAAATTPRVEKSPSWKTGGTMEGLNSPAAAAAADDGGGAGNLSTTAITVETLKRIADRDV